MPMDSDPLKVSASGVKNCHACGAVFTCDVTQQNEACWCFGYPAVLQPDNRQGCYCQDCLGHIISSSINEFIDTTPHLEALALASKFKGSDTLLKDIDYTIEQGNYVFSRWYHLKRGTCCGNGCKNCPFIAR